MLEHERLAVDDGLARRLEVVGQDVVELLLEELLHILAADARLGVAAVQHEADLLTVIAERAERIAADLHVLDGRQEIDDAEIRHDGRDVEQHEVQLAEHRGRIDDDVVEQSLQLLDNLLRDARLDIVRLLELARRGEHGKHDIAAGVGRQAFAHIERAARELDAALGIHERLLRLELQIVADIAELQVVVNEDDARALTGELSRHIDADERLADRGGRTEKGNHDTVDGFLFCR